jgi:hypothetical protein
MMLTHRGQTSPHWLAPCHRARNSEICKATKTMAPPKPSQEGLEQQCHQPLGGLSYLAYVTRGSSRSKDLFFWNFR